MFNRNEIRDVFSEPARVHYPWHMMEEYQPYGGMWATPRADDRADLIEAAEALMTDPVGFLAACAEATTEWPLSTSVALTTPGMNKRAWLGHAACFLATGSPEETTRQAWHLLDEAEQFAANDAADQAIAQWINAQHDVQGSLF
jgi:hypothetical protein